MENFMSGAMLIEGALLSFLLALWMAWLGLRGLFGLMRVTTQIIQPIRFVANRQHGKRRPHAA